MGEPHGPRTSAPSDAAALTAGTLLRDVATGETVSYEAWLENCVTGESRPREECVEELMNAVARGDLTLEGSGGG